jgi:acetamidase/formamidase
MTHHVLKSNAENCHWGYFDANCAPVLTIKDGDRVTIDCVSGQPNALPAPGKFYIPPELLEIHASLRPELGPHILTGPISIENAKPGQVLEIRILDVQLRQDWAYNTIRPLTGALPDDFHERRSLIFPLDKDRMIARLPWGLELPLKPFLGVMGTAPPESWGRISSIIPRAHGGNLDNKELVAGATLFLPIFVDGALFSCGDGHAAQGDGEVCVTAVETALQGTFEFHVHSDIDIVYPRAETPIHFITMGMDPDLDQCVVIALRDMIKLITEKTDLSKEDAYTLCSIAADLHVTQAVNGSKGIHIMLEKSLLDNSSRPVRLA